MQKQPDPSVIHTIMNRAIEINKQCPQDCRDFRIMTSPMRENTLILRWTEINLEDVDKPSQCFGYECFNPDGSSQNCSVNYDNQQEANEFFEGLQTLYKQKFAIDHHL